MTRVACLAVIVLGVLATGGRSASAQDAPGRDLALWYDKPAARWIGKQPASHYRKSWLIGKGRCALSMSGGDTRL